MEDEIDLDKERFTPEEEEQLYKQVPVDEEQVELVTRLAVKMLREGNVLPTLKRAIDQSADPAQVVGQFIVQLIAALAENLSSEMTLDPRIFLVQDGFLDHILDYIEDQLSYPEEFSDQVRGECLEMIRALAQGEKKPGGQQQGGLDQQGPPQGGMAPQQAPVAGPSQGGLDQVGGGF